MVFFIGVLDEDLTIVAGNGGVDERGAAASCAKEVVGCIEVERRSHIVRL